MKILWFIKSVLPSAADSFNLQSSAKEGWLINVCDSLSNNKNVNLSVAFFDKNLSYESFNKININNVNYYGIRYRSKNKFHLMKNSIKKVILENKPDVIHIWGSENELSYLVTSVCKELDFFNRSIVSIQGLVSVYASHYMSNLPWNVQLIPSLRDIIRNDTLIKQKHNFIRNGCYEKKTFNNVKYAIGRTTWDYACVKQINDDINYFKNYETLRESFYKSRWNINNCERYSIFVSQAQYPIKGFHNVLLALSILVKKYPHIKVYVSGADNSFKKGIFSTAYGLHLRKLIKKNRLEDKIIYLGMLNEKEMCNAFLKSHLFVLPSSIENSPNSMGEAMLLGMPIVASIVGGVSDLLNNGVDGFIYQSDAPYMMAYYIDKIFEDDELACKLSENAHNHACVIHNKKKNIEDLINIYKYIISKI